MYVLDKMHYLQTFYKHFAYSKMYYCLYCYKARRPNFSHPIEINCNVRTLIRYYVCSGMNKSRKNNYSLLGYNAMRSGASWTLQSNMSCPYSGFKLSQLRLVSYFAYFSTLKIEVTCTSETSFS
jgi:hypothetical protein